MIGILLYLFLFGGLDIIGSSMHVLMHDCTTLEYTADRYDTAEQALDACNDAKKIAQFNLVYFIVTNLFGFIEIVLYFIAVTKFQLPLDEHGANLALFLPSMNVMKVVNPIFSTYKKRVFIHDLKQAFYSAKHNSNLIVIDENYSTALFQNPEYSRVSVVLSHRLKDGKMKGIYRWNIIKHIKNLLARHYLLVLDPITKEYEFRILSKHEPKPAVWFSRGKIKRVYVIIKGRDDLVQGVNNSSLDTVDLGNGLQALKVSSSKMNNINESSAFMYSVMADRERIEKELTRRFSTTLLIVLGIIAIIAVIGIMLFMQGG